MVIVEAITCPQCGAPLDVVEKEELTLCIYCGVSVRLVWERQGRPIGDVSTDKLTAEIIQALLGSLDQKIKTYRADWIQVERDSLNSWKAFQRQKQKILGRPARNPRDLLFLEMQKRPQLHVLEDEFKQNYLPLISHSNVVAQKIELSMERVTGLDNKPPSLFFASWPNAFTNVLEFAPPRGPFAAEKFYPLLEEWQAQNLLDPSLVPKDRSHLPSGVIAHSVPVALTKDLLYHQAKDIDQRLQTAGAMGRIASTNLFISR
jgi:hypothetical protein